MIIDLLQMTWKKNWLPARPINTGRIIQAGLPVNHWKIHSGAPERIIPVECHRQVYHLHGHCCDHLHLQQFHFPHDHFRFHSH